VVFEILLPGFYWLELYKYKRPQVQPTHKEQTLAHKPSSRSQNSH